MTVTDEDLKQLRLLSIGHYVVAALATLVSLLFVYHVISGIAMLSEGSGADDDSLIQFFGWAFVLFSSAGALGGLGFAMCMVAAGRFLRRQRHYVYCLVMAALACGFLPFGTVLGAFTITILLKESVKRSFADSPGDRTVSLRTMQDRAVKSDALDADLKHLALLSVAHYVVAAMTALSSLFPLLHLVFGIGMVSGKWGALADDPTAASGGWFFIFAASSIILTGLAVAVGLALAGRFLRRQRHYLFCLIMAGVACMFPPFGTALGIFTIIVLLRDSVKRRFGRLPAAQVVESG